MTGAIVAQAGEESEFAEGTVNKAKRGSGHPK